MHVSGSWRTAFKDDMGLHKEDLHIKANADEIHTLSSSGSIAHSSIKSSA
jgi:hypothetical protein